MSHAVELARRTDIGSILSALWATGEHRFVFGVFRDVETAAAGLGWSVTELDRARRHLQEEVHRITTQRPGQIGTCRGDWILLAVQIQRVPYTANAA